VNEDITYGGQRPRRKLCVRIHPAPICWNSYVFIKQKLIANEQKQYILLYALPILLEQIGAGLNSHIDLRSLTMFVP